VSQQMFFGRQINPERSISSDSLRHDVMVPCTGRRCAANAPNGERSNPDTLPTRRSRKAHRSRPGTQRPSPRAERSSRPHATAAHAHLQMCPARPRPEGRSTVFPKSGCPPAAQYPCRPRSASNSIDDAYLPGIAVQRDDAFRGFGNDRDLLAGDDIFCPGARGHHRQQATAGADIENAGIRSLFLDRPEDRPFKGVVSPDIVEHRNMPERHHGRRQPPHLVPDMDIVRLQLQYAAEFDQCLVARPASASATARFDSTSAFSGAIDRASANTARRHRPSAAVKQCALSIRASRWCGASSSIWSRWPTAFSRSPSFATTRASSRRMSALR